MENKFNAFLRVIDPEDNATGGGAASAVAGSMAASLVGMVARLSVGKKNMLESDDTYRAADSRNQKLAEALLDGSNRDSSAFDDVMQAFRMPKATDSDKQIRSAAIQKATIQATEIPMQNAELCAAVLDEAVALTGKSNKNAASDLECAVFLAKAGLEGALSNAEINIGGIKDEAVVNDFSKRIADLRQMLDA